ncbi:MAG: hypothetical protein A2138_18860 [Deltaproteobacteria bacterium RBG_16_71_12]|nr:MAG: hypothetical protein A2138_18860 [Deltaproteobacteria bacterium RBG_16_71_12]
MNAERAQLARHHRAQAIGQVGVVRGGDADGAHRRHVGADAAQPRYAPPFLIDADDQGRAGRLAELEQLPAERHHLLEPLDVALEQDDAADAEVDELAAPALGHRGALEADDEQLAEREARGVLHGPL